MQDVQLLSYHQAVFDLIKQTPRTNQDAVELFTRWQIEDFVLPPSVREWYALVGADTILASYSDGDHPVNFSDLRHSIVRDGSHYGREVRGRRLLPCIVENQGCAIWLIDLNGSDDPPVVKWSDDLSRPETYWDRFSTFVFEWIWDGLYFEEQCVLRAEDVPLSPSVLITLRELLWEESPEQHQRTFYHLTKNDQTVLIWLRSHEQAYWWLRASTQESLLDLTRTMWNFGNLRNSLRIQWGAPDCAWHVLDLLRLGSTTPTRAVTTDDITQLLQTTPVEFMVQRWPEPVQWVQAEHAQHFWRERTFHVVDLETPYETWPSGDICNATEWIGHTAVPVVVLDFI